VRTIYLPENPKYVNMKRIFILLFFVVLDTHYSDAQTAEDSVKAVINQLFLGMKNADASLVQTAFADSAIMQTLARDKQGQVMVENDNVDQFATLVSGLKKGAADEQITFESIRIDGPLAMVWAPYKFFFEGNFSHCGVDSFQLIFINGHWKIQYLIDTRRRQPCD